MTIPAGVERLILEGRAVNRVVTHKADRFFINPPESGFIIVYGWEFHPPVNINQAVSQVYTLSVQVASDKGVDYYQRTFRPPAIASGEQYLDQVTYHSIYLVTEGGVQFNCFAFSSASQDKYGTVKDDNVILNNYPPEFAADFTDNNSASANFNYLVALDLPTNPVNGFSGAYYPFGSDYTQDQFNLLFTGVGFDSWLLAPYGGASVFRFNNLASTSNGEMIPANAFGITVHYAIVGEKLPTKSARGWIIEK